MENIDVDNSYINMNTFFSFVLLYQPRERSRRRGQIRIILTWWSQIRRYVHQHDVAPQHCFILLDWFWIGQNAHYFFLPVLSSNPAESTVALQYYHWNVFRYWGQRWSSASSNFPKVVSAVICSEYHEVIRGYLWHNPRVRWGWAT
jgi:hypothetical protein